MVYPNPQLEVNREFKYPYPTKSLQLGNSKQCSTYIGVKISPLFNKEMIRAGNYTE